MTRLVAGVGAGWFVFFLSCVSRALNLLYLLLRVALQSYIVEEFDFASIVSAGKKPNGSASEVPTDIKSKGKRPKAKAE